MEEDLKKIIEIDTIFNAKESKFIYKKLILF